MDVRGQLIPTGAAMPTAERPRTTMTALNIVVVDSKCVQGRI